MHPQTHRPLFYGSPRFADPQAVSHAAASDWERAWQATLQGDPAAALRSVQGNFAVGLQLDARRVLLAVDRFAIRSLCYRVRDGQLAFADSANGLADNTSSVDAQAIFDYLYFHVIPSPRTIYTDIFRLPPGHFAVFQDGQLTVAPYWIAAFDEQGQRNDLAALGEEFRSILQAAVAQELDGSKPACFLSGGTDSSTVAGMVARASGQGVDTYSIGFDAQGYDEMEYARIAARHFQARHHEYYVTPTDLVRDIPAMAAHFDQPFGNSSALPAYCCARMAREDGVTKLLAGDGGDELFGGNSRYAKQRVFGWYGHVPGALRKHLLEPSLETRAAAAFALGRKAHSYVTQARVPIPDRLQMYNLIMRLGPAEVLTQEMMAQIDQTQPLALQRSVWQMPGECSALNRELAFDWRFTLAESDLPKVLGATSLAKVAVGFPMLDQRLLDFSLRLPTHYKLKGLQLRWFFKEALRGFLPDEIIRKKKQGFGLPFGVWAHANPALHALARDAVTGLVERKVVREDFVRNLFERHLPEHPGYFGEMVWILMMLEQWLRAKAPGFRAG